MLVCMKSMHMDMCVCEWMCMHCGVCERGKEKREKEHDVSLLMYYGSFVEFFFSSKLMKGWLWICCLKEMNLFSPTFLRTVLKEAHSSDISHQNYKPAKCICIILGIFYWRYSLNVESQLIFLDLQKVQGPNYILQIFCYYCAKFSVSSLLL